MRAILASLAILWAAQAHAAEYVEYTVRVPVELVEQGILWHGGYGTHRKNNLRKDPSKEDKAQFFLDNCVLDSTTLWVLDSAIFAKTWGKVRKFNDTGITVEVKR